MSYGWIITKDHLESDLKPDSAVGTYGPSRIPATVMASLWAGNGYTFTMRDDDGVIYYTGRAVWSDDYADTGAVAPLDNFGMPNAGCTSIRYHGHPEFDCE